MAQSPLRCIVVTPEETVLETEAEFIAVPLYDGELGIASGHAPMIGRLGYGELRIRTGGQTRRFYVDGGFVQVADNLTSVLTNRAVSADRLQPGQIETTLKEAQGRSAAGDDAMKLRDRDVRQTRAQLRVARRSAGPR